MKGFKNKYFFVISCCDSQKYEFYFAHPLVLFLEGGGGGHWSNLNMTNIIFIFTIPFLSRYSNDLYSSRGLESEVILLPFRLG